MEALNGISSNLEHEYYDRYLIRTKYLESRLADTSTVLWGETFQSPAAVSALCCLPLFGAGENASAELSDGIRAAGVLQFQGASDEEEWQTVLKHGDKVIRILKPIEDLDLLAERLRKSEQEGAFAVGIDIDHLFTPDGRYDEVAGEKMGPKSEADIRKLVQAVEIPFIMKGVLSVEDAQVSLHAGVRGLFVSTHNDHYRYNVPSPRALQEIKAYASADTAIFMDGAVRDAYDVYKALAWGADIVAIGRSILAEVKKNGAKGVTEYFKKTENELRGIMSWSGRQKIKDITIDKLVER